MPIQIVSGKEPRHPPSSEILNIIHNAQKFLSTTLYGQEALSTHGQVHV